LDRAQKRGCETLDVQYHEEAPPDGAIHQSSPVLAAPVALCVVLAGHGGNSAVTVNVPLPSGLDVTLFGGGLFALKRSIVIWSLS
jgi:hypothetical protein